MKTQKNPPATLSPAPITTRRQALAALGGFATFAGTIGVATVTQAAPDPLAGRWANLLRSLEWSHPNGLKAGLAAKAAGMDPDDLTCTIFKGLADETKNHRPTLLFWVDGESRMFDPSGEVI